MASMFEHPREDSDAIPNLLDLTPTRPADAGREDDAPDHLSHPQLIERIIQINPSATSSFLSRFRPQRLADYLDHLICSKEPRGSVWVRRGDTPGIVSRSSDE